jgi:formate hydrogenlyase subunit 6/NADH:ubiquinone oxidoreductase subunit I
MDALQLEKSQEATNKKDKAVVLDAGRCIGCGICVYKCPSESLVLECREEICDPPKDVREWTKRWFADKKAASKKDSINGHK